MKIVTWNINSVRLRIELLARMVAALKPDIVCLQETKTQDQHFPAEACKAMGFPHLAFAGMESYNGVAILSRLPLADIEAFPRVGRADCRHLAVTLPKGIRLHNLYIPAGGDEPDPEHNDKFAHKLDFVAELARWFPDRHDAKEKLILAGDFNIAPLETDVWSHTQLLGVVSHTPIEVEHLERFQASLPFTDAVRHVIPPEERLYSWWSYRARDWLESNRGRRLDHIWVSKPLVKRIGGARVFQETRGWTQPSDHVPVLIEIED